MAEPDDSNDETSTTIETERGSVLAGHRSHTIADVKATYREQASMMARMDWLNRILSGRYRRALFGDATGRVLDVACGVGTNAQYLDHDTEYVGIDISDAVLTAARQRLDNTQRETTLYEMDAQDLDFPDDSFDTVISSLSTCTFPDPVAALSEMGRVCVPEGRILLLEHGRSSVGPIARFQDWRADAHFEKHNCRWNQEPLAVVGASPLQIRESSSAVLGMITAIEASPE
ncbi:class I SAM-dependent methyltransferase [Haloarcula nitratireducens]|uniref:Class I SAM-dependent methyltransferase n=1 Tax=Haloarcula nitratireducens TaxID=2487749 RepID=A0AAW4PKT8_9EURY|nr:class I SAM-dependent methyltransferase [Halomicroarcula nitratireducens]MBX0298158.1 class I SAM-dependent methyltransferase [Halomicroarcula nitratireducens]